MQKHRQRSKVLWMLAVLSYSIICTSYVHAASLTDPNTIQISWVANHGFIISGAGKKVMIDSLFTAGGDWAFSPTEQNISKLRAGEAPFDKIDVVLTTHAHGDHIDFPFAVQYLQNNPGVEFVAPPQTVTQLQAQNGFDQVQATITTVEGRAQTTIKGVSIEHISMPHHGSLEENIAFLINLNGVKILHVGDAAKYPNLPYASLALDELDVDVLIAPFSAGCSNWYNNVNGQGPRTIRDFIKPKHLLMGHITAEWDSQQDIDRAITQMNNQLPGTSVSILHPQPCPGMLFTRQGDRISINGTPDSSVMNQTTGQPQCSIQRAIDSANDGDVLLIEPGIHYETLNVLNKNITLQSMDPNDPQMIGSTIIQGDGENPVLSLTLTQDRFKLRGLTLRAGSVGIFGSDTYAIIEDCRIMDNVTDGIHLYGASPSLKNCLITGNSGHGMFLETRTTTGRRSKEIISRPNIDNCIIVDNGEASISDGDPNIVDSVIEE